MADPEDFPSHGIAIKSDFIEEMGHGSRDPVRSGGYPPEKLSTGRVICPEAMRHLTTFFPFPGSRDWGAPKKSHVNREVS